MNFFEIAIYYITVLIGTKPILFRLKSKIYSVLCTRYSYNLLVITVPTSVKRVYCII